MKDNQSCALRKMLFADDTSLIGTMTHFHIRLPKSNEDIRIITNRINSELALIHEWLKINKLSLNIKNKLMIFHTKNKDMSKNQSSGIFGTKNAKIREKDKIKILLFL